MPTLDANVLKYAFGDVLYDMGNVEKCRLKKVLWNSGKLIGARKVRRAVNDAFEHRSELVLRLRHLWIDKARSEVVRLTAQTLMLTIPSVFETASRYFSDAKDCYTVPGAAEGG